VAAERSIAELLGPLMRGRSALVLRPGITLPSGTTSPPRSIAARAPVDEDAADDTPPRINMPEQRPARAAVADPAATDRMPAPAPRAQPPAPPPVPLIPPRDDDDMLAGLPSAAVAAE